MARQRPLSPLPLRARVLLAAAFLVLLALSVHRLFLSEAPPRIHEFSGDTMGTTYLVKIVSPPLEDDRRSEAGRRIAGRLDEIDRSMSSYIPESEVSRFNRHQSTAPFRVSELVIEVLEIARVVSERSRGAFDVTIAPLVDAYGFGPEGPDVEEPGEETLARLLEKVGYERVEIDAEARTLRKTHPEVVVDLSAIAKGFAVDRVARAIAELGFDSFLIEVGGELKARGRKPDGTPWRVAIEAPDPARRTPLEIVDLLDSALATSGDYRNFFERDGRRYAHLIDPRTGRPLPQVGMSVSVVHPDAVFADAWATALCVLDPEEGRTLADREGLAVLWILAAGDRYERRATEAYLARHEVGRSSR